MGADDYLSKPFGMMEMVSRVKALLRRTSGGEPEKLLSIGDLEMNPAEHTVKIGGEPVDLTLKEFNLLKLFLEHKGLVFPAKSCFPKFGESSLWARPERLTYISAR